MTRRTTLGALALLFGLAVGALLAEVTLRVYAHTSDGSLAWRLRADPYAVLIEPHGVAGYRPRPGRVFTYENDTESHINSMGFRGPEVAVPKPAISL